MRARGSVKLKPPRRCIFSRRTALPRTFEIPEGDAGVSRAISSDSEVQRVDRCLFPPFFVNLFPGTRYLWPRMSQGKRKRGDARRYHERREFSTRTDAKDILEGIPCLLDDGSETRNVTDCVHCLRSTRQPF